MNSAGHDTDPPAGLGDASPEAISPEAMSPQSIDPQTMSLEDAGFTSPRAHVVLYQPEIPPNTGNIGRTCVAVEAKLWLVQPLGFDLSSAAIRRSGLDYWQHLDVQVVSDWSQLLASLPQTERMFFLSRHAKRPHWEPQFEVGDVFVFGSESSGLPASILDPEDPRSLRLPTNTRVRSLNLATTAGIVMYEHFRQIQVV